MKSSSLVMSAILLAIFTGMTVLALVAYPEGARFQPLVVGVPAIGLCVLQLVLDLRAKGEPATHSPGAPQASDAPPACEAPLVPANELRVWGWFLGLIAGVLLLGFWITIPVFVAGFLRVEAKAGWPQSIALGALATGALYALFGLLLRASLHEGFLLQWIKG